MVEESIIKRDYELSIDEAKKMVWYHTIELTPDFTTKGIYDWRPYWDKFAFGDLRGKTVLDVGAGDGFFSFEFERRGAKVTALDIPSQEDRDNAKIGVKREYSAEVLQRGRRSTEFKTGVPPCYLLFCAYDLSSSILTGAGGSRINGNSKD